MQALTSFLVDEATGWWDFIWRSFVFGMSLAAGEAMTLYLILVAFGAFEVKSIF